MHRFITIISIVLLMNISVAYGMEITSESTLVKDMLTLQASDFTTVPNDVIQSICEALFNFNGPNAYVGCYNYNDMIYRLCCDVRNIAQLNATCRYLNHFSNSLILAKITAITEQRSINELLFYALESKKTNNFVKLCIKMGADVNGTLVKGWMCDEETPLISAINHEASIEIITFLLDHGVDINLNGYEPFSAAIRKFYETGKGSVSHYVTLIKLLITYKANLNQESDHVGAPTPLLAAVLEKPINSGIWRPQKQKASVEEENFSHEIIRLFIKHGADVNKASNGWTPLLNAAHYNDHETMKILIMHGADVQSVIALGRSNNLISEETIALLNDFEKRIK